MAYGPDVMDQQKRAAGYVDRILKGEKPADLNSDRYVAFHKADIARCPT